ncbi:MAG: ABC transporter permease [Bacteroidia bacterium]|jgi:ABC-type lipoprotein release transport system permease subunit|nr:ABC transporter permease [Bacteroidia bacterium]
MNLPFAIAKRYFFSRKSSGSLNLISILSGISLVGYVVGAAALLVVLSVFNGFEVMFMGMYNHFDSDIQIVASRGKTFTEKELSKIDLNKVEGIWKYAMVLEENALFKYGDKQNLGTLKGVDSNFALITGLDSSIVAGQSFVPTSNSFQAIAGQGIAYQLSINPNDPFEPLVCYIPSRGEVDMLNPMDAFVKAVVSPTGVFAVQEEVDNKYVIVPLTYLQETINRPAAYTSVECKLVEGASSEKVQRVLQQKLGTGFKVKNRFEQREAFYKVMQSEKVISYFILFFILIIAAGNTIGTLYILVLEKRADLNILAAMGLTPKQAQQIFMWQGVLMSAFGGLIGIGLGALICYLQETYGLVQLDQSASFMFNAYPVALRYWDMLLVGITVLFLGTFTAIYPAYKAKKLITT